MKENKVLELITIISDRQSHAQRIMRNINSDLSKLKSKKAIWENHIYALSEFKDFINQNKES